MGLNSGRLYGASREQRSSRSVISRDEQAQRLRASVMEMIGDAVPGIVNCVVEFVRSYGDRPEGKEVRVRGHLALVKLRALVDLLSELVLRPPAGAVAEHMLASRIVGAYRAFASSFEALGFHLSMSDSLGVFYARKVDAVVFRIARFFGVGAIAANEPVRAAAAPMEVLADAH